MKKLFTKLMAVIALLLLSCWSVNAQTVTLVDSYFTDWTTAPTSGANGDGTTVYSITGASIVFKGTAYNSTSLPNAGTSTTYPNFFRFGSNMDPQFPQTTVPVTMNNQYLKITPTSPFVNGGKITLYVSNNNGTNIEFQVGDIASGQLLGGINTVKNTVEAVVVTLPSDFSGIKTIVIGRKATTIFLHAIKIETNQATETPNTNLKDLKVDGTTVAGFDAAELTYNVTVPYAYSGIPTVTASANYSSANALVTQATSIPGSATVDVTADGVTATQYTVNFTRIPVSTACDITSFKISGHVGTINTDDNTIVVSLPSNTDVTALTPVVTTSSLSTYSPTGAQNFTNPVDYVVTAEDETTQKIYHVSISYIEPYSDAYPYETTFPVDFTLPAWMWSPENGITFNSAYNGTDYSLWTESGETTEASVIRFNSYSGMELYLSKCSKFTADLTATANRVYTLYVNGTLVVTSPTVSSGSIYSLTYDVNVNAPVIIKIDNQNNGGVTLGHLKVEGDFLGTGLNNTSENDIYFDGKIIRNSNNIEIAVFDIAGRLVKTSMKDIDMNGFSKGIYVVKSLNKTLKIAHVR